MTPVGPASHTLTLSLRPASYLSGDTNSLSAAHYHEPFQHSYSLSCKYSKCLKGAHLVVLMITSLSKKQAERCEETTPRTQQSWSLNPVSLVLVYALCSTTEQWGWIFPFSSPPFPSLPLPLPPPASASGPLLTFVTLLAHCALSSELSQVWSGTSHTTHNSCAISHTLTSSRPVISSPSCSLHPAAVLTSDLI